MLITARSFTTTQRLHSYKFTLVDKAVHRSAGLLSIAQDAIFYNVVRMHTRSLGPKPRTTVTGLGARLVLFNKDISRMAQILTIWFLMLITARSFVTTKPSHIFK